MQTKTTPLGVRYLPEYKRNVLRYNRDGTIASGAGTVFPSSTTPLGVGGTLTTSFGRTGSFQPCYHDKLSWSAGDPSGSWPTCIGRPGIWPAGEIDFVEYTGLQYDAYREARAAMHEFINSNPLDLNSVSWLPLSAEAVDSMWPSFDEGNSLVNFMLELGDFRKLAQSAFSKLTGKKYWKDIFESIIGSKSGDKPLARLAKGHLSYAFAWRPLYNDVVSFWRTIAGFRARYQDVINRANKPQQRYWGKFLPGTSVAGGVVASGSTRPGSWFANFNGEMAWRVQADENPGIRYHATMRYRYQVPEVMKGPWGQFMALADSLGVNANPAIIWNAIPFSFVVDWIINIGRVLDSLRVENVPFQLEILDFCHSAKVEARLHASMFPRIAVLFTPLGGTASCGTVVVSKYQRHVGFADLSLALQTTGLSLREVLLGGSLIGAKSRRRGRRRFRA